MCPTAGTIAREALTLESMPELMTRAELAAFTGLSHQTLAKWAMDGRGPTMTKLGTHCRYRRDHVQAWLDASSAPAEVA